MKHSKDWKDFIKHSSDIKDKDIHPNIDDYSPKETHNIDWISWYDCWMMNKREPIVTKLFITCRKFKISFVFNM